MPVMYQLLRMWYIIPEKEAGSPCGHKELVHHQTSYPCLSLTHLGVSLLNAEGQYALTPWSELPLSQMASVNSCLLHLSLHMPKPQQNS